MATWRYIKGSEKDFEGAPEWATVTTFVGDSTYFLSEMKIGERGCLKGLEGGVFTIDTLPIHEQVIAQRERVPSINDDWLAQDVERFKRKVEEVFKQPDNVNHPKHYTQGGIECIDAIKAATVGKSGIEAVCVANVVKYLWRYEEKNGVEDVKKARWYLERLISELSEGESK